MNIVGINIVESIVSYIKMVRELSPGDTDCKAIDDAILSIFETDYLIQNLIALGYDNEAVLGCFAYSIKVDFQQLQFIYEDLDISVLI